MADLNLSALDNLDIFGSAPAISGPAVVSDNAKASSFFGQIGQTALSGLRGFIDIEIARRTAQVPDRADVREVTQADAPRSGLSTGFSRFSALQIGGLVVAGGLFVALVTGQFR